MRLEKSRRALKAAEEAIAALESVASESLRFREEFEHRIGTVFRVGQMIDSETSGHRTDAFGEWWKKTSKDPLFLFMKDVRNAEFKQGDDTKSQHVSVELTPVTVHASVSITYVARNSEGEIIRTGSSEDTPPQPPQPPAQEAQGRTSIEWHFNSGTFSGQEVLGVLRRYVEWMRDEILPTAERLTS